MAAATRILKRAARRAATKLMGKFGQRLVAGMADTSSDSPAAIFEPKRDLYSKMKDEAERAHDHGHDHDHKE